MSRMINYTSNLLRESHCQWVIITSADDLAPNKKQAITTVTQFTVASWHQAITWAHVGF